MSLLALLSGFAASVFGLAAIVSVAAWRATSVEVLMRRHYRRKANRDHAQAVILREELYVTNIERQGEASR